MISFEFDNYTEPEMMVTKERDEKNPLCSFNPNNKSKNKKKIKIIKLKKKQ